LVPGLVPSQKGLDERDSIPAKRKGRKRVWGGGNYQGGRLPSVKRDEGILKKKKHRMGGERGGKASYRPKGTVGDAGPWKERRENRGSLRRPFICVKRKDSPRERGRFFVTRFKRDVRKLKAFQSLAKNVRWGEYRHSALPEEKDDY